MSIHHRVKEPPPNTIRFSSFSFRYILTEVATQKKMGENWTKVQTRFMVKNCKKRTCDVASAFHILHDSNQPRRQHAPNRKLTTHQPNGSDSTMFLCARWCQKKCSLLLTIDMRLNARNSRCCCRSQDKFEPRTKDSRDDNTQKTHHNRIARCFRSFNYHTVASRPTPLAPKSSSKQC